MTGRLRSLAAIATTAVLLAGCGAERRGRQAASDETFMARANRICAEAQEKIYAIPEPSDPESLQQSSEYLTRVLAVHEERLKAFRALTPPQKDRKTTDELEAELAKGVESIRLTAKAAANGDKETFEATGGDIQESVAARSRLARRARLMECVNVLSGEVVLEAGPKDSTLAGEQPFNLGALLLLGQLRGREAPQLEQPILSDNGFAVGFARRWTKANSSASYMSEVMEFKTPAGAQAARRALEQFPPPEGVQIQGRKALEVPGVAGASGFSYSLVGPAGTSFVNEIFFVRGFRLFRVTATSAAEQPGDEAVSLAKRQERLAVEGVA